MDIEELVQKYKEDAPLCSYDFDQSDAETMLSAALTELAAGYEERIRQVEAAQYVPVVGEPVAWFYEDPFSGNYLTGEQISCNDIPLYFAPATCITQAELERLRKDAERYAVVRDSTYCDVYMHEIYLTDDDLDAAIDAAIAAEGEKK